MQKYSHNSRRVQKELGGDVYALSGRVDTIEEDVTRLEGYEETIVKEFIFDAAAAEEKTLKAVLTNSDVMEWLCGEHYREWTHMSIKSIANTKPLDGTYNRMGGGSASTLNRSGDLLKYKQFTAYPGAGILGPVEKTLKADTSTGALSYGNTNLDITGDYSLITIDFMKGELKS